MGRRRSGAQRRRPTVISIEWDYWYDSLLIDRSPGVTGVDFLDPDELGLSPHIGTRMRMWLEEHEALERHYLSDEPETDYTRGAEAKSDRDLLTLAYDIAHELEPDVKVLLNGAPITHSREW